MADHARREPWASSLGWCRPVSYTHLTLVQAIYDDSMLKSMFEDGNKPKVLENPLNDRFEKAEFQKPVSYTHLDVYKRQELEYGQADR